MSMINAISDVNNTFLSRRELICNFTGLGGKLKKLDAVDMITKEFNLDGKIVIPINMTTHVGKPLMTGTFYVYEDEVLAKKQVNPTIFTRLEKTKKKIEEEKAKAAEEAANAETKDAATDAKDTAAATDAKDTAAATDAKDTAAANADTKDTAATDAKDTASQKENNAPKKDVADTKEEKKAE